MRNCSSRLDSDTCYKVSNKISTFCKHFHETENISKAFQLESAGKPIFSTQSFNRNFSIKNIIDHIRPARWLHFHPVSCGFFDRTKFLENSIKHFGESCAPILIYKLIIWFLRASSESKRFDCINSPSLPPGTGSLCWVKAFHNWVLASWTGELSNKRILSNSMGTLATEWITLNDGPTYRAGPAVWTAHGSDRHFCRFSVQSWKVAWLLWHLCSPSKCPGAREARFQEALARGAAQILCLNPCVSIFVKSCVVDEVEGKSRKTEFEKFIAQPGDRHIKTHQRLSHSHFPGRQKHFNVTINNLFSTMND